MPRRRSRRTRRLRKPGLIGWIEWLFFLVDLPQPQWLSRMAMRDRYSRGDSKRRSDTPLRWRFWQKAKKETSSRQRIRVRRRD